MSELLSGARSLPLATVQERAQRAASGLASLGVSRGDLVAVYLRNDFPLFEASFAAGMLGAYPAAVNWHYGPAEARYVFEDSGARAIIIHADLVRSIGDALPRGVPVLVAPTPTEIAAAYCTPAEDCAVPDGMIEWGGWLEQFAPHAGPASAAPGAVIYTSGTTGRAKGVRRFAPTPEQEEGQARVLAKMYGLTEIGPEKPFTIVVTGPMYHAAPNTFGLVSASVGAKVILQPRFDAEELLQLIEQHRVTHLHMVPIMFNRLLRLPDEVKRKYDLSSLQFVVHAAAPCPIPIKRAMIEWWGPVIFEYYGSTEMGPVTFCNSADWLSHPGTVGRVIEEADVKVVDAQGKALPPGDIGEVIGKVRCMPDFTYHRDPAKRAESEKAGLITPGDIGYLDQDGFLYLCDRAKDMIISGGVNIYPAEIESELHKMPGVADCAVFGIPDEEFGESVCAAIQLQPGVQLGERDVKDYLRLQLAGFKVPKRIEFHAVLPREDSGKIFKRKLREPHWEGLNRRI